MSGAVAGRSGLLAVWVLVGWTLFVWVNRIRNVLVDPDLATADRIVPLAMSGAFVVAAVVVAVLAWRERRSVGGPAGDPAGTPVGRGLVTAVRVLAVLTTVIWVVRAIAIAASGDHPVGFVAVHVVLAIVSIGIAVWAVISVGGRSHKLLVTA